MKHQNTVAVV